MLSTGRAYKLDKKKGTSICLINDMMYRNKNSKLYVKINKVYFTHHEDRSRTIESLISSSGPH